MGRYDPDVITLDLGRWPDSEKGGLASLGVCVGGWMRGRQHLQAYFGVAVCSLNSAVSERVSKRARIWSNL
jgi:hypothetical protein